MPAAEINLKNTEVSFRLSPTISSRTVPESESSPGATKQGAEGREVGLKKSKTERENVPDFWEENRIRIQDSRSNHGLGLGGWMSRVELKERCLVLYIVLPQVSCLSIQTSLSIDRLMTLNLLSHIVPTVGNSTFQLLRGLPSYIRTATLRW